MQGGCLPLLWVVMVLAAIGNVLAFFDGKGNVGFLVVSLVILGALLMAAGRGT
jgi:hypothetical protein